ncbi:MAG: hypothetical protein ABIL01_20095 [Pseudomonadota bacterium]
MASLSHSAPAEAAVLKKLVKACLASCAFALTTSAFAADPDPTPPIFKPAPGAVVSGLSGLVTGSKDSLLSYRSQERITAIRRELTDQLLQLKDLENKISVGRFTSDSEKSRYRLSNESILCEPRGSYAVVAADANYIATIASSLNRFALPSQISTISDALGSLFQSYSIEAPRGQTKKATAQKVNERCTNDATVWASFSYGRTLEKATPTDDAGRDLRGIEDFTAAGSAISGLYAAIIAILQPIVVGAAKMIDVQKRADVISNFITENRVSLISAAENLADRSFKISRKARLDAFSSFAERMAVLRGKQIDLGKVSNCKSVVTTATMPLPTGAPGTLNKIPTDDFVLCYSEAWGQIADSVQEVLNAANKYDLLADASDDNLQQLVAKIKRNISQIENPSENQIKELWDAAAQLIAFGQTVNQSLSKENIEKGNKAISELMKLFTGRSDTPSAKVAQ